MASIPTQTRAGYASNDGFPGHDYEVRAMPSPLGPRRLTSARLGCRSATSWPQPTNSYQENRRDFIANSSAILTRLTGRIGTREVCARTGAEKKNWSDFMHRHLPEAVLRQSGPPSFTVKVRCQAARLARWPRTHSASRLTHRRRNPEASEVPRSPVVALAGTKFGAPARVRAT